MILKGNETIERYGLTVRLVDEDDAEFIYTLRTNSKLSRYISHTDERLENQVEWIKKYKIREAACQEYYFMFLYEGVRLGVVRVYDIEKDHFTQGSWVFSPEAPLGSSVLGNVIGSEMGFDIPGMEYFLSDVRKGNSPHKYVRVYHPEIVAEDDENVYYKLSKERFEQYKHVHIDFCSKIFEEETKGMFPETVK